MKMGIANKDIVIEYITNLVIENPNPNEPQVKSISPCIPFLVGSKI